MQPGCLWAGGPAFPDFLFLVCTPTLLRWTHLRQALHFVARVPYPFSFLGKRVGDSSLQFSVLTFPAQIQFARSCAALGFDDLGLPGAALALSERSIRSGDSFRQEPESSIGHPRRKPSEWRPSLFQQPAKVSSYTLRASMPNRIESKAIAAARFAQKNSSILLDTHILGRQARAEVSPFQARLPLPSPSAVSLKAKLRIEL
jgi:hypothetical protein